MRARLAPTIVLTLCLCACGGGDDPKEPPAGSGQETGTGTGTDDGGGSEPAVSRGVWSPDKGVARVTGTVHFKGDAPKRRTVDMGSDPVCQALHAEPIRTEVALVDDDGHLANAFVWVRKGLEGWEFPVPTEVVAVTQEGCRYIPHVIGVQVGQPFEVRNSDPNSHNVHAFPVKNKSFNRTQAEGSKAIEVKFTRPEVLLPMKCDLHGWMSTYIGVVEDPFFAVSAEDGTFDLGKLPPGEYQICARHEVFGLEKLTVTIAEGDEDQAIEFTFEEE